MCLREETLKNKTFAVYVFHLMQLMCLRDTLKNKNFAVYVFHLMQLMCLREETLKIKPLLYRIHRSVTGNGRTTLHIMCILCHMYRENPYNVFHVMYLGKSARTSKNYR